MFLVRLTTCVGEEFPVVSETRNLLKIGGDHLAANPILVCETVLIGEGDALDANSIRFKGGDSMKESHFLFRKSF